MMKYYMELQNQIEEFIENEYLFEEDFTKKKKAGVDFKYRHRSSDTWLDGEAFGKNERSFIAEQPEFAEFENTIKMYFPYRLLYKMVADKVLESSFQTN